MRSKPNEKSSGFALVELMVVVVVIALVAGAIVVGQSVLRNAELQSIITDVNRYKNAAKLFLDKYKYLPGDFPRASEFWGADAGCPTPLASLERARSTCSGNGDGMIGSHMSEVDIVYSTAQQIQEVVAVWQHLSNAGMIEGQYSGRGSPDADDGLHPGVNIPASGIARSGFTLHFATPYSGTTGIYPAKYRHVVLFGRVSGPMIENFGMPVSGLGLHRPAYLPAISSQEAARLDSKVDDARPGTGHVLSFTPEMIETPECATTSFEDTAAYRSDSSQVACSLIFISGL